MLSKCADCKYHHPDLCAVNPSYKPMQDIMRSRLSQAELAACDASILPCNDWEPLEELQPLMLELTLSRQEWRQLLSARHGLPRELIAQVQSAISQPGEVVMIPVESSNIAAIGYSDVEGVLLVDFLSGTRYRYSAVPAWKFEAFLAAPSKGRYLNSAIKGEYDFERVA